MKKLILPFLLLLSTLAFGSGAPTPITSVSILPTTCNGGSAGIASDQVTLITAGGGVSYSCAGNNTWVRTGASANGSLSSSCNPNYPCVAPGYVATLGSNVLTTLAVAAGVNSAWGFDTATNLGAFNINQNGQGFLPVPLGFVANGAWNTPAVPYTGILSPGTVNGYNGLVNFVGAGTTSVTLSGSTFTISSTGGSGMVWPAGLSTAPYTADQGIPNFNGNSNSPAWLTTFNNSNPIPANYLMTTVVQGGLLCSTDGVTLSGITSFPQYAILVGGGPGNCPTAGNGVTYLNGASLGLGNGSNTGSLLIGTNGGNGIILTGSTQYNGSLLFEVALTTVAYLQDSGVFNAAGFNITGLTGGPFCLHETAGAISPTTADCGAGGGNPPLNTVTGSAAAKTITETGTGFPITFAGVETGTLTFPYLFNNTAGGGSLLVSNSSSSTPAFAVNQADNAGEDIMDLYYLSTVTTSTGVLSGGSKIYQFGFGGALIVGLQNFSSAGGSVQISGSTTGNAHPGTLNICPTGASCAAPSASIVGTALSLGSSGVSGSAIFGNATSGLLTLQTVTGALGTVAMQIPIPPAGLTTGYLAQSAVRNGTYLLSGICSTPSSNCTGGQIAATTCINNSSSSISATGVLTTDVITFTPNAALSSFTGFAPVSSGGLTVDMYPTAGGINVELCNWSSGSITVPSLTLNYRVSR